MGCDCHDTAAARLLQNSALLTPDVVRAQSEKAHNNVRAASVAV